MAAPQRKSLRNLSKRISYNETDNSSNSNSPKPKEIEGEPPKDIPVVGSIEPPVINIGKSLNF